MALPIPRLKANTSQALTINKPLARDLELRELLDSIYKVALEGNVTAAKLYLDYHMRIKGDDPDLATVDDVYKILAEKL